VDAGLVIRARTLGVLDLAPDGEEIPPELRWRKNAALLVYLSRSPDGARTREHLCGIFWPDKPEAAARHSLNEALRVLRKALPEGAVDTDARRVRLADSAVSLDVDDLDAAIEEEEWERAAALVGGEFLEGFGLADASGFEDWLAAERSAWRDRSLRALVGCASERLARGDVTGASELGRRSLALDPFSDLAAQTVIRALALAGDRGGALGAYEAFARHLEAELGTAPAPETERVADRVRRERTWRLPEALAGDGRPSRTELIGRETELARILAAWDRCRQEARAAVVFVEGESGAGKTRLLEELSGRARLDGGAVAAIRAVPADRALEWSALRGLCQGGLADVPGVPGASDETLRAITAEVPEWAERFRVRSSGESPPLPRAFSEVLRLACEEQPVLLVVDDAEWLDGESRDALVLVLRDLEDAPLAVALAASGPEGREALDEVADCLGSDVVVERLAVARWSDEQCLGLVGLLLPEFDPASRDRLARRILADSAGLPLLAVEIARAVRDGLTLDGDGPTRSWPDTNRTLEQTMPGDLPDTVRSAIRVGFRRLSKPAQTLLAAASIADGARFDARAVAQAAELGDAERDAALDELEWARWLHAEPRGYSFVARIVRDVVSTDMLTPGQRERIRGRLTDS